MTSLALTSIVMLAAQATAGPFDCKKVDEQPEVSLADLGRCAAEDLGVIREFGGKTKVQRERAELKLAIELVDAAEKQDSRLVTESGAIRGGDYHVILRAHPSAVLEIVEKDEPGPSGLSVGRKLVDNADPSTAKLNEKVPFLVSYRNDREGEDSGLTVLGKIEYKWGSGLPVQQTVFTDIDSSTKDDRIKSSITFGYSYSLLTKDVPGELFDDAESIFGFEWNTDRGFRRKAYAAHYTFIPSSEMLGAGYRSGRTWDIAWQPSVSLQVGNVIDAAGNEALEKRESDGGFARVAPSFSLATTPQRFPKLSFGISYLHTWDLTHRWDRGLLEASATYSLSKGTFVTLVHRYGAKKISFDDIDETLFGIGVTY
ncbi:hypothetical protein IB223_14590 [Pseudoxanthomonas sp. PXM03]|uniref:hypothetical protein n=1 Tax=Pseudoxanthomonas sp. PXM03 TaxID=2769284 RepID=UPI00178487B9|nr:hypothetical protein [Pseudoxanthomonas sp. PXM03]MBD9437328.1 hypothetical protein [Pseudoxanthomonas sp. PXM03]